MASDPGLLPLLFPYLHVTDSMSSRNLDPWGIALICSMQSEDSSVSKIFKIRQERLNHRDGGGFIRVPIIVACKQQIWSFYLEFHSTYSSFLGPCASLTRLSYEVARSAGHGATRS